MSKKSENFLEFIPVRSKNMEWKVIDDKNVQLILKRDKLIDKIVRKFFKTPDKTTIDLDEMGSFIWMNIDGCKNVYQISKLVGEHFGKKAEPLNERLITFINILRNNKFIMLNRN